MYELRVEQVNSSARLSGALSPGRADEHGDFDGETLLVADRDKAEALVENHNNVEFAATIPEPASDDGLERETIGGDDPDARTNDAGKPLCAGTKSDGEPCGRTVDEPGGYCHDHAPEADA